MKRTAAALLALIMVLTVTGCSKKKDNNDDDSKVQEVVTDGEDSIAEVVDTTLPEPETKINALDKNSPVPKYEGGLSLSEQRFDLANLTLKLPQGINVEENEEGLITVLAKDGRWRLTFTPVDFAAQTQTRSAVENELNGSLADTVYADIDSADADIQGFSARVYAKNIYDKWYNANANYYQSVDIFMDYGDEIAGQWNGMYIRLDTAGYETNENIYELLRDEQVRAILNSFEIIRGDSGQFMSVNGLTATFPSRWSMVSTSYLGPVASFRDSKNSGCVYVYTADGADPAAAAAAVSEDTFELTYGERKFTCAYREVGGNDEREGVYYLDLFSEFSDKRCMYISLFLSGADKDELLEYAKGSVFTGVAESIKLDPTQYFEEKSALIDTFACDNFGVITAYNGVGGEVKIPTKIGDIYVTGIASNVFRNNETITSVELPEGLRFVSDNAFSGCVNLSSVKLCDSLSYIGNYAFSGNSLLADVTLHSAVSMLGEGAFMGTGTGQFTAEGGLLLSEDALAMSGFGTITLGDGTDISGSGVFRSSSASKIDTGSGYTAIGENAFEDCVNLKEMTIPASVESIGAYAFAGADSLSRVTLPLTLQTLGAGAFSNCDSLTTVLLPNTLTEIPEGCFNGTRLHTMIVPESVKTIKADAFGDGTKYVCLMNAKDITLEDGAIHCSMLYFNDVYETEDAPENLENQSVVSQVLLPVDATISQTEAFDKFLDKIGFGEIAWIGIQPEYLARDYYLYQQKGGTITGFTGNTSELRIPFFGNNLDQVLVVGDSAFEDSDFTAVYFTGEITAIASHAFNGSDMLKDMWFTTTAVKLTKTGALSSTSLEGLPDDVTIHLPATLSEEDKKDIENAFKDAGLSDTATFDYYTLG